MLERNFDIDDIYTNGSLLMRAITPVNAGDRLTISGTVSTITAIKDKSTYSGRISGENHLGDLVCLSDFTVTA